MYATTPEFDKEQHEVAKGAQQRTPPRLRILRVFRPGSRTGRPANGDDPVVASFRVAFCAHWRWLGPAVSRPCSGESSSRLQTNPFLSPGAYSQIFTMHGTTMM